MSLPVILGRILSQLAATSAADFVADFVQKKQNNQSSSSTYNPSGPGQTQGQPNPQQTPNQAGNAANPNFFQQLSQIQPVQKLGSQLPDILKYSLAGMLGPMIMNFLRPPELPSVGATIEAYGNRSVGTVPYKIQSEAGRFVGNAFQTLNPLRGPGRQIEAFADNIKMIAEFPATVERWGMELSKSQEHLTKYNSAIAQAYTIAERRRIMRDIRSADKTSFGISARETAMADLSDKLQGLRDVITNLTNIIVTALIRVAEKLVDTGIALAKTGKALGEHLADTIDQVFPPIGSALKSIMNFLNLSGGGGQSLGKQFAEDILKSAQAARQPLVKRPVAPGGKP